MTAPTPLRLGTRGSALALVQAHDIQRQLQAAGFAVEIVVRQTIGDLDKESAFSAVGPPGIFVREIETALQEGDIDLAVHCYKDLPSVSPDGLVIGAVPPRANPGELLIVRRDAHVPDAMSLPLAPGAAVGTSAARRRAQLAEARPDLDCRDLRGNVPTRIQKLIDGQGDGQGNGQYDAIVLAAAGIERLAAGAARGENDAPDLEACIVVRLDPEVFVPAPSQGALALQVRADDATTRAAVAHLHDPATARALAAERMLLGLVQAGCEAPLGGFCRPRPDGDLELFVFFEEAGRVVRAHEIGREPEALARAAFAHFGRGPAPEDSP